MPILMMRAACGPASAWKGFDMIPQIWTRTPAQSNERVAALISDAFNRAAALDPARVGAAPRDVSAALRFAMRTDAGAFLNDRAGAV